MEMFKQFSQFEHHIFPTLGIGDKPANVTNATGWGSPRMNDRDEAEEENGRE